MKYCVIFLFVLSICFCNSQQAKKTKSNRQLVLEEYIKKYQDRIDNTSDTLVKMDALLMMSNKRIRFIQDTLKFVTYPVLVVDTFYFESAIVDYQTNSKGTSINVMLHSELYDAHTSFLIPTNVQPADIPIYKMLKELKKDAPVLAIINVQDFWLHQNLLKFWHLRPVLVSTIEAIYNFE